MTENKNSKNSFSEAVKLTLREFTIWIPFVEKGTTEQNACASCGRLIWGRGKYQMQRPYHICLCLDCRKIVFPLLIKPIKKERLLHHA